MGEGLAVPVELAEGQRESVGGVLGDRMAVGLVERVLVTVDDTVREKGGVRVRLTVGVRVTVGEGGEEGEGRGEGVSEVVTETE